MSSQQTKNTEAFLKGRIWINWMNSGDHKPDQNTWKKIVAKGGIIP